LQPSLLSCLSERYGATCIPKQAILAPPCGELLLIDRDRKQEEIPGEPLLETAKASRARDGLRRSMASGIALAFQSVG